MENASKALIMAGSILLSLMVIGAIVFLYRDISSSEVGKQEALKQSQIAEFNKSFLSFEKDLYGSELLSLANKVIDYDEQIDRDQSGYTKMKLILQVKNNYGSFITAGTYTIDNGNNIFKNKLDAIEVVKNNYGGDSYLQRLSGALSYNNEEELTKLLKELGKTVTNSSIMNRAKLDIQLYTDYIEFKRMKFVHKSTNYDTNGNGRITEMRFEEK